ncbi:hypothetical protein [Paraburkholderia sp. DGU8]|uniref:hypothetical protein n=1 Tax=Paraburkholderia sp. DGU8 TaxID=3161997 RepID=UPI003465A3B3
MTSVNRDNQLVFSRALEPLFPRDSQKPNDPTLLPNDATGGLAAAFALRPAAVARCISFDSKRSPLNSIARAVSPRVQAPSPDYLEARPAKLSLHEGAGPIQGENTPKHGMGKPDTTTGQRVEVATRQVGQLRSRSETSRLMMDSMSSWDNTISPYAKSPLAFQSSAHVAESHRSRQPRSPISLIDEERRKFSERENTHYNKPISEHVADITTQFLKDLPFLPAFGPNPPKLATSAAKSRYSLELPQIGDTTSRFVSNILDKISPPKKYQQFRNRSDIPDAVRSADLNSTPPSSARPNLNASIIDSPGQKRFYDLRDEYRTLHPDNHDQTTTRLKSDDGMATERTAGTGTALTESPDSATLERAFYNAAFSKRPTPVASKVEPLDTSFLESALDNAARFRKPTSAEKSKSKDLEKRLNELKDILNIDPEISEIAYYREQNDTLNYINSLYKTSKKASKFLAKTNNAKDNVSEESKNEPVAELPNDRKTAVRIGTAAMREAIASLDHSFLQDAISDSRSGKDIAPEIREKIKNLESELRKINEWDENQIFNIDNSIRDLDINKGTRYFPEYLATLKIAADEVSEASKTISQEVLETSEADQGRAAPLPEGRLLDSGTATPTVRKSIDLRDNSFLQQAVENYAVHRKISPELEQKINDYEDEFLKNNTGNKFKISKELLDDLDSANKNNFSSNRALILEYISKQIKKVLPDHENGKTDSSAKTEAIKTEEQQVVVSPTATTPEHTRTPDTELVDRNISDLLDPAISDYKLEKALTPRKWDELFDFELNLRRLNENNIVDTPGVWSLRAYQPDGIVDTLGYLARLKDVAMQASKQIEEHNKTGSKSVSGTSQLSEEDARQMQAELQQILKERSSPPYPDINTPTTHEQYQAIRTAILRGAGLKGGGARISNLIYRENRGGAPLEAASFANVKFDQRDYINYFKKESPHNSSSIGYCKGLVYEALRQTDRHGFDLLDSVQEMDNSIHSKTEKSHVINRISNYQSGTNKLTLFNYKISSEKQFADNVEAEVFLSTLQIPKDDLVLLQMKVERNDNPPSHAILLQHAEDGTYLIYDPNNGAFKYKDENSFKKSLLGYMRTSHTEQNGKLYPEITIQYSPKVSG